MGFKDEMINDVDRVFLDQNFFGETRDIRYNGVVYEDVPVVLTGGNVQTRRTQRYAGHSSGIYNVTEILHCSYESLGRQQPENGIRIAISDPEYPEYFKEFYVKRSLLEGGMLRVEMEAVDE